MLESRMVEFLLWIDRRSLKPLKKVVSNLEELRARPAPVLVEGEITIGPYRRWGTGTALGLALAVGIEGTSEESWPGATGRLQRFPAAAVGGPRLSRRAPAPLRR